MTLPSDTYATLPFRPDKTACLIIDVQGGFCDPEHEKKGGNNHTVKAAEKISRLKGVFNATAKKTALIYYDPNEEPPETAFGGLYKIYRTNDDCIIAKKHWSAFENTGLNHELQKNKIDTLVISGVYTSGCIRSTVMDALKSYNVIVLQDCIANGGYFYNDHGEGDIHITEMQRHGAVFMSSDMWLIMLQENMPGSQLE